jgi:serine protease AprX
MIPVSVYEKLGLGNSNDYFRLSGTSMATPVVSGAAALLIQQQTSITPDQVKAKLMKTATKALNLYSTGISAKDKQRFSNQSDIFTVGAGYLNIRRTGQPRHGEHAGTFAVRHTQSDNRED